MYRQYQRLLNDFLFFFYAIFVFGSTFSIALAQIGLGVSIFFFIAVTLLIRRNPFQRELKWFYLMILFYILWMAAASIAGATPSRSLFILKEEWLFVAVPIGLYLMSKDFYRTKLIVVLAAGVALVSLYGIVQHFTGVTWFKDPVLHPAYDSGYMAKGFFAHRLTFGNYYSVAAALFATLTIIGWHKWRRNQRLFFGAAALLAMFATFFSYSRGPIAALVVVVVLFGLILSRRVRIYTVLASVAVLIIVLVIKPVLKDRIVETTRNEFRLDNHAGRIFIWNNSFKIIAKNPILGVGQGNFYDEYVPLLPPNVIDSRKHVHAHNDLINIAVLAGIPGLLLFGGMWAALIALGLKALRRADRDRITPLVAAGLAGALTFLLGSMTEATFADEEVRQMLMFVWALTLFPLASKSYEPEPICGT